MRELHAKRVKFTHCSAMAKRYFRAKQRDSAKRRVWHELCHQAFDKQRIALILVNNLCTRLPSWSSSRYPLATSSPPICCNLQGREAENLVYAGAQPMRFVAG